MKIINLIDQPEHINQLAEWHQKEWGYLNPDNNLEKRIQKMSTYLKGSLLPSMYIAKKSEQLVGSAALIKSDMDTRKNLSPWLASVFVSPNYRKQGIGALLVEYILRAARENGFKKLYLFTPNKESFYNKIGWDIITKEKYRGQQVTIMTIDLDS